MCSMAKTQRRSKQATGAGTLRAFLVLTVGDVPDMVASELLGSRKSFMYRYDEYGYTIDIPFLEKVMENPWYSMSMDIP